MKWQRESLARAAGQMVVGFLLFGIAASAGLASSIVVEWNPDIPHGQIEAAIAASSPEDSILVGPGHYFENMYILDRTLILIGIEGAEKTILDGSMPVMPDSATILSISPVAAGSDDSLVVRGITFTGGRGTEYFLDISRAGAVSAHGNTYLRECVFDDNRADDGGGALGWRGARLEVRDCAFSNNIGGTGGSIYASVGEFVSIEGSSFDVRFGGHGMAIYADVVGPLVVRDCLFEGNFGSPTSAEGLALNAYEVILTDNRFFDYGHVAASRVVTNGPIFPESPVGVIAERNLFVSLLGEEDTRSAIFYCRGNSPYRIANNTFVGVRALFSVGTFVPDVENLVTRNIFYHSRTTSVAPNTEYRCNDFFPYELNVVQVGPFEDNVHLDPEFCDPDGFDFSLSLESPLLGEGIPAACESFGAVSESCGVTPVLVGGVELIEVDAGVRMLWVPLDALEVAWWDVLRTVVPAGESVEDAPDPSFVGSVVPTEASTLEFVDEDVRPATDYAYWVEAMSTDGTTERFGPWRLVTSSTLDRGFLGGPNPFHVAASSQPFGISFANPQGADARLVIYDVAGRVLREIDRPVTDGDTPRLEWDGRREDGGYVRAGLYLYVVELAGQPVQEGKIIVAK